MIGDYVKIVKPALFRRCGYPLTPEMVQVELNTSENRQRIIDMLNDFDVPTGQARFSMYDGSMSIEQIEAVLKVIAYHTVRIRHFGGSTREIYTHDQPVLQDDIVQVVAKKTVRTGIRVPGSGGGEDYESAYLDGAKSHVILGFWPTKGPVCESLIDNLWIEAKNVVLQPHESIYTT